jgi:hypothetical protein
MIVNYSTINRILFRILKNSFIPLLILFQSSVLWISCSNVDEFSLGSDFVEPQTKMILTDTFRVELSTIMMDSLSTSGTGIALVGDYTDKEFGRTTCTSYFETGLPANTEITSNAEYDSCAFILTYSKYFYGDTTSLMSLSIHRLTENITLHTNGYLNNTSKFGYSKIAIGTKIFYPNPLSSDSTIKISVNEFGRNLFTLFKNNDNLVSTSDIFRDYIKGFVLTSGNDNNNSILGFYADSLHSFIKIYFHVTEEASSNQVFSIALSNINRQFNNIRHDFSNTSLAGIDSASHHRLLSTQSADRSFLQAGVGLFPKIQFPTLQDIFLKNRWKILKAILVIVPVKTSYDIFSLPENLYLYDTDKHNYNNGYLTDQSGEAVKGTLVLDKLYNENTSYSFDLTNFITNELADKYVDYNHGILVGMNENKLLSTIDRLEIEDKTPRVKLKLYYVTY